jgi:hypothetical protein
MPGRAGEPYLGRAPVGRDQHLEQDDAFPSRGGARRAGTEGAGSARRRRARPPSRRRHCHHHLPLQAPPPPAVPGFAPADGSPADSVAAAVGVGRVTRATAFGARAAFAGAAGAATDAGGASAEPAGGPTSGPAGPPPPPGSDTSGHRITEASGGSGGAARRTRSTSAAPCSNVERAREPESGPIPRADPEPVVSAFCGVRSRSGGGVSGSFHTMNGLSYFR